MCKLLISSSIALDILILVHCNDAYQRAFVDRKSYPTRPLGEPLELVYPEDKPMVNKYPNVLPNDILGKPLHRGCTYSKGIPGHVFGGVTRNAI